MQYFICRYLKQVVSEKQCARMAGQCGCGDAPSVEAPVSWKRYNTDEVFGDEFYREYKAVYLSPAEVGPRQRVETAEDFTAPSLRFREALNQSIQDFHQPMKALA